MVEEGSSGGGEAFGKKPLALGSAVDAASGECVMTAANNSGGVGRLYPCPDCEKVFRHPRSYYQHQHVHRGTHSCPGCGKLFSRRWDLLRHLNKNKYGCPARWREGTRHPPYHNSLSLSALASAAAVAAASSQEGTLPPVETPDHHQPVSWTIPSGTTEGVAGRQHSSSRNSNSSSGSSGSNGGPRPPEPPTASRASP